MNTKNIRIALAAGLVGMSLATGIQSLAQDKGNGMNSMGTGGMQRGATAMHEMMMKSAQDMMDMKMPMDSDTDRMFDKSMAMHHQMGIEMARLELKYGNDPDSKRLAAKIIAAQTRERAVLLRLAKMAR